MKKKSGNELFWFGIFPVLSLFGLWIFVGYLFVWFPYPFFDALRRVWWLFWLGLNGFIWWWRIR